MGEMDGYQQLQLAISDSVYCSITVAAGLAVGTNEVEIER
jgi:hypothetical protein